MAYRIQVATDTGFVNRVVDQAGLSDTTFSTSVLSNATTYYWRVYATNEFGTSPWSATYAFLTNRPPDAPSNPSPADGVGNQAISLTLSWTGGDPDPGDTVRYDVYFDTVNPPVQLVSSGQLGTSLPRSGLSYNTTYYWKIVARDRYGLETQGPVWRFTTGATPNNPPYTSSNPSPPDWATDQPLSLTLSWTGGDPDPGDTVRYDVYFDTVNPPIQLVSSGQLGTTLPRSGLSYSTTYYWKIVATDNHGASTQGPVWRFTTHTNNPPYTPSNPSPVDGATDQPVSFTLSWSGGDPDPGDTAKYDVYFDTVNPPVTRVSTGQLGTSWPLSGLSRSTIYYWKIVAFDNHGASTQGPVWRFTTVPPPWFSQSSGTTNYLVSIHFPMDAQTGYAAGYSGTILKTTDGGANWVSQTSGITNNLHSIHFPIDAQTGYAVGDAGTILKTADGGANWVPLNSGTSHYLFSVHFPMDAQTGYAVGGYAGGNGIILKTTDGGASWVSQMGTAYDHLSVQFPVDAQSGYVVGRSGTILKTTDGGANWVSQTSGTTYDLWSVHFPMDASTGYAVGDYGVILKTMDGGAGWVSQNSGTTNCLFSVKFPVDTQTGYVVGVFGTIRKTTDGGANWVSQSSGTTRNLNSVHFPVDAQTGYVVGYNGTILKTVTGGQ